MLSKLVAPALLGAATGLRSQVGVAALLSRRDFMELPRPWSLLGTRTVRTASQLAAVGELIGDKLRTAPPRTEPGPLMGRVAFGALAGALLDISRQGRFRGASAVPAAFVGAALAAATSFLGQAAREGLSERLPVPVVAVGEDTLALTLGLIGANPAPL